MKKKCSLSDCQNPHYQAGFCGSHYLRNRKYGDPYAGGPRKGELMEWIKSHLEYAGDDCIEWPYYRAASGYGRVKFDGKDQVASRVMCILAHGEPPESSMDAAHSCGKGHLGCMNPNHLSWKTRAENNSDKKAHGTHRCGSDINFTKLSESHVVQIYKRAKSGESQASIAKDFNVAQTHVSRIFRKTRWMHILKDLQVLRSAVL